jgi:hypothetical protein
MHATSPSSFDVSVTRSGREEITLRLEDDEAEAVPGVRENPPTSELELFAHLIRWNGGEPEEILRLEMLKMTKRSARVGPRLGPLLEADAERRRRGAKARGPANETHRKRLRRTLDALVLFGYVRDPEKKRPIWAAIEGAERKTMESARLGQENLSHEKGSTSETSSVSPVNAENERREGEPDDEETNLNRRPSP